VSYADLRVPKQTRSASGEPPASIVVPCALLLAFWLFVLSGVAFLDRTNISIAGLQMSRVVWPGRNQKLALFSARFLWGMPSSRFPAGWLANTLGAATPR